jgi:hypothetical protein
MLRGRIAGQIAGVVLAVGLSGCAGTEGRDVALDPAGQQTSDRTPKPREPRTPRKTRPATPPTPEQAALARAFVAFAAWPGPRTAAALPWAPRVWLGLGENLFTAERRSALAEPETWDIDVDAYGAVGPMNALRPVRLVARRDGAGALATSVGGHPQCVGGPSRAPASFRAATRISIQPADPDSCLQWFAVDLYVDARGQVIAVTLEQWEP